MILARITSQYSDVYLQAIDSNVCRSSLERFISNGLFLGISNDESLMLAYQITSPNHALKYVTVFSNRSTKLVKPLCEARRELCSRCTTGQATLRPTTSI